MPARLAISANGRHGQYVGTTREYPPSSAPGTGPARYFNGTSDRIIGRRASDLGNTFVCVLSFWRADSTQTADNQVGQRLFSQPCVGGTRVGVGLNRSFISVTYTDNTGMVFTVESATRIQDTERHTLLLQVTASQVIVMIDGREAIRRTALLAAPDTAYCTFGSDANSRFFKGWMDDVACYQTPPLFTDNWMRYYRSLLMQQQARDYIAAPFGPAYHGTTIIDEGYTAVGTNTLPEYSRAAAGAPFRLEAELNTQFVEFRIAQSVNNSQVGFGVISTAHNLQTHDIGQTDASYLLTQSGEIVHDGQVVLSGLPTWTGADVIALGWVASTRVLSFWKNGAQIHSIILSSGTWFPAVRLGSNTVRMNTGQAPLMTLPWDTPGLPIVAYSRLTTQLRQLRLGELAAPLDDPDDVVRDSRTGVAFGTYLGTRQLVEGFTEESLDMASLVSGGIQIGSGAYTSADADFFWIMAIQPTEADLEDEVILLEVPGKAGLKLIDGRIYGWVGDTQVGAIDPTFEDGGRYLIGMTVSSSGRILLWCHLGYMLQSADPITPQQAGVMHVGSDELGDRKFQGKISHLILSSASIPRWKLDRLRLTYDWDDPNVEGLIPNPATVRRVFEPSYRDIMATGISLSPGPNSCYVAAVAKQPDAVAIEYRMATRVSPDPFAGTPISSWTPTATLQTAMPKTGTNIVVSIQEVDALDDVEVGQAVLIDDEICRIEAVSGSTLTLARACVDTVPAEHGVGSTIWFYEAGLGRNSQAYAVGAVVETKLLSRSALSEIPEDLAPTDVVVMDARQQRPYPPAGIMLNGEEAPASAAGTVEITWLHRNRVTQATDLVAWTEPSYTANAGVTYVVRAYNRVTGELLHESHELESTEDSYNLLVDFTGELRVTVTSYQNGRSCRYVPSIELAYTSEVTVLITSEEGEALQTEDGQLNVFAENLTAMRTASFNGELPDDYDFTWEEEEEEDADPDVDEPGAGVIMGVKISEFEELSSFVGDEMLAFAKGGTNYRATVTDFLTYVISQIPAAKDGLSAYELAKLPVSEGGQGFVGTLAEWLESQRGPEGPSSNMSRRIQTITGASGTVVCNWANYDEIRVRITGPVTFSFTGAKDGQGCMLKLQQDGVGNHPVTFPASVKYNALVAHWGSPRPANMVDKVGFVYDGASSSYDLVSVVPDISN